MVYPTHSDSNEFRVKKRNHDYATWAVLFQAVVLQGPFPAWMPAAGTSEAPGARRPAGVGDAGCGGPGRDGGAGAGMTGPPANRREPPKGRARPPRPALRAPRGAVLPRPEHAAGDSRPGATRRLQRVARGTVTPRRL